MHSGTKVAAVLAVVLMMSCTLTAVGKTPRRSNGGGAPEDDLPSFRTQILWANAAHTVSAFIPQEILETTPIDELPLSDNIKSILRDQVESFSTRNYAACSPPAQDSLPQGAADTTYTFDEFISHLGAAFVGKIVHLEPGLSSVSLNAAEAAYIRVEEVLFERNSGRAPQEGAIVAAVFHGGRTVLGATPICRDWHDAYYRPVVGDRVLMAGGMSPDGDPLYFAGSTAFPLSSEGVVLSQPYMNLDAEERWISLGELRVDLGKQQEEVRVLLSGKPWKPDPRFFYDVARFPVVDGEVRPEPRFDLKQGERARALGQLVRQVRVDGRSESLLKGVER